MSFRKAFRSSLLMDARDTERRLALIKSRGRSHDEAVTMDEAFLATLDKVGDAMADVIDDLPEGVRGEAAFYIMRGIIANLDSLETLMVRVALEEAVGLSLHIVVMGAEEDCDCPTCVGARAANATSYRTKH